MEIVVAKPYSFYWNIKDGKDGKYNYIPTFDTPVSSDSELRDAISMLKAMYEQRDEGKPILIAIFEHDVILMPAAEEISLKGKLG